MHLVKNVLEKVADEPNIFIPPLTNESPTEGGRRRILRRMRV
jgi:hypothetical protein